jgi:hypothetical protein
LNNVLGRAIYIETFAHKNNNTDSKIPKVPAQTNKQTADELVPLLLFYVPKFLQPAASNLVGVLMGDRLRKAMMYVTSIHESSPQLT